MILSNSWRYSSTNKYAHGIAQRERRRDKSIISLCLLLSGDIHQCPGPENQSLRGTRDFMSAGLEGSWHRKEGVLDGRWVVMETEENLEQRADKHVEI